MKKRALFFLFVFYGACQTACFAAKDIIDEKTKPYEVKRVIKTVEGHNFLVPEDRPVEMIAGQYRPVDIDTYVAYKFGTLKEEMDAKFANVDKRLSDAKQQEERILKLEQEIKELYKKVEDLAARLAKSENNNKDSVSTASR